MKIKEFVKKYKIISFLVAIIIIGLAAALILHYKNDPIANIKGFYRRN